MIIDKIPYRIKFWLINFHMMIVSLPNLIIYHSKDMSNFGLIGSSLSIDASTICQLKCPICPTSKGINKKGPIGWGYLKFNDFKHFIDNHPNITKIELSCWGEIFLNPELEQILKYAYYKNIILTANSGVNLNNVNKNILEKIVKYKLFSLNVSLDGTSNKSYKIYRKEGNFDKVILNIKLINHFKKLYNSKYPKLNWQFIIFGHNEHELVEARRMAKRLGMSFYPKFNKELNFSPVKNKNFVRGKSKLNVASRDEFFYKYKKIYLQNCRQLWTSPQINWDGKLFGCCDNIWISFGNVFKDGLKNALKNEKFIYTKKVVLGKEKIQEDIPCSKCHKYKYIQKKPIKIRDLFTNFIL